jgi:hypothetical protein
MIIGGHSNFVERTSQFNGPTSCILVRLISGFVQCTLFLHSCFATGLARGLVLEGFPSGFNVRLVFVFILRSFGPIHVHAEAG